MIALDFNKLNQISVPDIYLAQKNKHKIGCLNAVGNLKLDFFLNDMNTCSFTVPRIYKGKKNNCYDEIETKMLILVVGFGWYEIKSTIKNDGEYEIKEVSGKALEYELTACDLYDFEVNSGDIDYDDYQVIKFYNPINPSASLLHKVLDDIPSWNIGHVDESLWDKQRSFDVDNQDVYSFLTGDVSEAFECFFIFDSFTRTVNVYVTDDYGRDTIIYLSFENLNQSVEVSVDDTQIKTVYRVIGGDGIYINEVNPNGTNKIYDYSYYLNTKYMKQSTIDAYNRYQVAYNSSKEPFKVIMERLQGYVDDILELEVRVPDDLTSTNWSLYGLTLLNTVKTTRENTLNTYINLGYGDISSSQYNTLYLPLYNEIQTIETEIVVRKNQIEAKKSLQSSTEATRDAIQNNLNPRNYLTEEEWIDLSHHNYIATYTNENYITTDLDSDAERIATEQALYDVSSKELGKFSKPQYSFSSTTSNLLARKEFEPLFDDFELGNFIRVEINEENIVKMRLISYTLDFNNLETMDVQYSDMIDVKGKMQDAISILEQASSTTSSVNSSKNKWNDAVDESTYVYKVRKEGLNAALVSIMNSENQEVVIDSKGITGREYNKDRQDYEDEQYRLTKNLLAFTDDNWRSVRSAFGKMIMNGTPYYGLIADALISKINIAEALTVSNETNTIQMDKDGAKFINCDITIVKGENTIKMGAMDGISLSKGTTKQFYLDSNGNLNLSGNVYASIITGSSFIGGSMFSSNYVPNISGTYINLNDGTIDTKNFKLSSTGIVSCVEGNFSGTIYATGGNIAGFTVDTTQFTSGTGNKFIRISPYSTTPNTTNYSTNYGAIDLGLTSDNLNTMIHLRSDGYARFGLVSSNTGAVRLNYKISDDEIYSLHTDTFKIRNNGTVTCRQINGESGYALILTSNNSFILRGNNNGWIETKNLNIYNGLDSSGYLNFSGYSEFNCNGYKILHSGNASTSDITPSYTNGGNIYFKNSSNNGASVNWCNDKFALKDSSDFRLKKNIKPLDDLPIELFMAIKTKMYEFKINEYGEGIFFGVIAQEIENAFESFGYSPYDYNLIELREVRKYTDEGFYVNDKIHAVNYTNFIAWNILVTQKLYNSNIELQHEIQKIKNELEAIKKDILEKF